MRVGGSDAVLQGESGYVGVDGGFAVDGVVVFKDGLESFVAEHGAEGFDGAFVADGELFGGVADFVAVSADGSFAGDAHFGDADAGEAVADGGGFAGGEE